MFQGKREFFVGFSVISEKLFNSLGNWQIKRLLKK
jgi:hypothetical protein